MVKADLIRSIELQLNISHPNATLLVDTLLEGIKEGLGTDESVSISRFGKWKLLRKKERMGCNPKTKEAYTIVPRTVVSFYPSDMWKQVIAKHNPTQQNLSD